MATLQKYRVIKQPGKPVGPHVDFARDEQGNLIRGKPYKDPETKEMNPGDFIERQYYPGDEVWSEADLTKEMNGQGAGLCKAKFERADEVGITPTEIEEFRAWKAARDAGNPQPAPTPANPAAGLQTNEELNKTAKAAFQQRVSPESLNAKSYKELVDLAKAEGVDTKNVAKKEDLVKVILAALNV